LKGRILVAVSSVGLGHASRARVYGSLLESMGFRVEYYAPEPAGSYLRAWGSRVLPVSWRVGSLSSFLEKHWLSTGRGVIGLRASLEEYRAAKRFAEALFSSVDLGSYDLVVADESWEIAVNPARVPARKLWIADFIGYRPRSVRSLPAALAVNRFILKLYRLLDACIYVGLPGVDLGWRMTPLGPRASDVMSRYFARAGPVPGFIEGEELDRASAASRLRLPLRDDLVLIMLGGTRAGEDFARRAASAASDLGLRPVIASGPRARPGAPPGSISLGYDPLLPISLSAFRCAYTLAGLSTISTLAAAGLPAALNPLPGHFEQEENAAVASRLWSHLFVRVEGRDPRSLKAALETACSLRRAPVRSLHENSWRVAGMLAENASGGG
jgi:hypothetical protein